MWELAQTILNQNSLGAILLAAFFTVVGIFVRGILTSHKDISVAKINANVSYGEQAMQALTAALETLRDENLAIKEAKNRAESHLEQIIDLLLQLLRAETQEEADKFSLRLEQLLKSIGRWHYHY